MNNRVVTTAAVLLVLAGCAALRARQGPPAFSLRGPYEPLLAKLQASGGDPAAVLRLRTGADLSKLQPGLRYKFAILEDGVLVAAPVPVTPANDYTHPILAGGKPVRTAGQLVVDRENGRARATIDQDSKAYCPTFASLERAREVLVDQLGVKGDDVVLKDRPPVCLDEAGQGAPSMGAPSMGTPGQARRDGGP